MKSALSIATIATVLTLTALTAFLRTDLLMWEGDDLLYQFVFEDDSCFMNPDRMRRVETFGDIVDSQVYHYLYVNGRTPAQGVSQIFGGLLGQRAYAIFVAIMMALLVALTVKWVTGRFKASPWWYFITAFALLYPPNGGGPWYGLSLGCNYLLPAVLAMLFLIMFQRGSYPVAGGLLSLILGWSNEAFSVPLSMAALLFWIFKRQQMNRPRIIMTLTLWVGTALTVFSPGTLARAFGGYSAPKSVSDMLISLVDCYTGVWLIWLLAIAAIALIALRKGKVLVQVVGEQWQVAAALASGLLFSIYAHTYSHSLTFIELLSLILILSLVHSLLRCRLDFPSRHLWLFGVVGLAWVAFESEVTDATIDARHRYADMIERWKASPDGATYYAPPSPVFPVSLYMPHYRHSLTPAHYTATKFAVLNGQPHKQVLRLLPDDYRRLISQPDSFFTPANMLPGTAHAYVGEAFHFVVLDSVSAADSCHYRARYQAPAFMQRMSRPRRLFYHVFLNDRKASNILTHEIVGTRNGIYALIANPLSVPSAIDKE